MSKAFHINNEGDVLRCSTTPEKCEFIGGQFNSEVSAYESDAFKEILGNVSNVATLRKAKMSKRRAFMNDPNKIEERKAANLQKQAEELEKLKQQYSIDAELSWGEIKPSQKSIHIYRSGKPNPLSADERGVESESYVLADSVRPEGRTGRLDGFCASPTLGGVARWVDANAGIGRNQVSGFTPCKIKVDLDTTYIYEIRSWELASVKERTSRENTDNPYSQYWDTGITLREFVKLSKEDPDTYNPTKWEILLQPEEMQNEPQPVSYERIAKALYSNYDSDRKKIVEIGKAERRAKQRI